MPQKNKLGKIGSVSDMVIVTQKVIAENGKVPENLQNTTLKPYKNLRNDEEKSSTRLKIKIGRST